MMHNKQRIVRVGALHNHRSKYHEVYFGVQRDEIRTCAINSVLKDMSELMTLVGIAWRAIEVFDAENVTEHIRSWKIIIIQPQPTQFHRF